jgi:hypothetical protein
MYDINRIEQVLNHKIFAFGTSAFDNAFFISMITASHEHDVDDKSTKWIGSMLKKRTARAEIKGVRSMMDVCRGCPQSGV